ncbi:hypothetical protein L6452_22444 [Arctium lappa]|uniref:Uncharacterized protein n=1 Tax=Arctium lappa TaxID=4217 RepID=A0ACB9AZU0_ARCLA|nr:hypothetical protein L6452_22444 [Arctium lappa]
MSSNKELSYEIPDVIRVNKDGIVERLMVYPYVPPSLQDPISGGISSKDILISPHLSARLYLPKSTPTKPHKLPIFVYIHGGGFVIGSAFAQLEHNYLNTIVSHTNALVISVEYRLAPEHLLPTAYQDCWTALQWVASHATSHGRTTLLNQESWLVELGDFERLYIGGDSAGANIVHNLALQAGRESLNGDVKILGGFLGCPYFWSSLYGVEGLPYGCWMMAHPQAEGGIDNPMINPFVGGGDGRRLIAAEYGVRKLLVVATEKDELREINIKYFEGVKESEWDGEVEFMEIEGENHCFYVLDSTTEKAKLVMERLASFIV